MVSGGFPCQDGSSPREWGTLNCQGKNTMKYRFIPTRVGNTTRYMLKLYIKAVHPHACGEHRVQSAIDAMGDGSSPREWGTHVRQWRARQIDRFIPTRVGNTPHRRYPARYQAVHPHASGEHSALRKIKFRKYGSSPREWGTLWAWSDTAGAIRFIPTRVGNTPVAVAAPVIQPVHPHASGEHRFQPP